ncbi:MAG: hypothetical protein P4L53_14760 [Candidatus Obscuribacterales bacterium]|nr:hypothetical protein [Candidatus Obscuribacterales bacterium]
MNLRPCACLKKVRGKSGASLALVITVLGGLGLLIAACCLTFTGMLGSYQEQRSAIEAASLAAAKDLSAIVIEDPNFGFIGLSDSSPTGTATTAGDGFYTSVTGINTLFGTIRLDMIIADYLQDPVMSQLVATDYANALIAQKNLVDALNKASAPYGTGVDKNGVILNPTQDALTAYISNSVHLTAGQSCSLVTGSLHLTLGFVDGLASRTAIPQPPSVAALQSSSLQSQGFYVANEAINYTSLNTKKSSPFSFASLDSNTSLVDYRKFLTNHDDLPFATPSVVKVDADELFTNDHGLNNQMHAVSAAQCGTVTDQRPYPGAFTLTFVNGTFPEVTQFLDLINSGQIQTDPADLVQTPPNGDYPQTALSPSSLPMLTAGDPAHPSFEDVLSLATYEWIKRGGTMVNVQSLITAFQTPLNFVGSGPQQQRFHLTSTGAVTIDSAPWGQQNFCVSQNQFRALSGAGIVSSNGSKYDLQITDFVHIKGRVYGGKHAGEPLDMPGTTVSNPNPSSTNVNIIYENGNWPYCAYLNGGGGSVRPSYNQEGIACDFTFRLHN